MRSGIAFLVLIAACGMLVLAGCDAPEASADAEAPKDGTEVVNASNTGEAATSGGCAEASSGCSASCDKASSEDGCMKPISASAAEGGAEMTTAENKGGGCPYAAKAAAAKADCEKACEGMSAEEKAACAKKCAEMSAEEKSECARKCAEKTTGESPR